LMQKLQEEEGRAARIHTYEEKRRMEKLQEEKEQEEEDRAARFVLAVTTRIAELRQRERELNKALEEVDCLTSAGREVETQLELELESVWQQRDENRALLNQYYENSPLL
jgi:hypothetical protein